MLLPTLLATPVVAVNSLMGAVCAGSFVKPEWHDWDGGQAFGIGFDAGAVMLKPGVSGGNFCGPANTGFQTDPILRTCRKAGTLLLVFKECFFSETRDELAISHNSPRMLPFCPIQSC